MCDDLKTAIENRAGNDTSHPRHARAHGKDLGTTTPIYVDAKSYMFCSAVVSRKTIEADPHNIVFCPYVIAVYTVLNEPKKVYVAYRRPQQPASTPQSQASLKAVEELLDGIAREALNLPSNATPSKPIS